MADDLPRSVTAGIYPVERGGELTFAWSHPVATISLRALDRRPGWTCAVVARGARPAGTPQPEMIIGVDGVTAARSALGNEFQRIEVAVPGRRTRGVILTITAEPAYTPGPSDPRPLGVQLDRIDCTPASRFTLPSREVFTAAILAGAVFGLLFAALATSAAALALSILAFGVACALPLTTGPGSYVAGYTGWWLPATLWIVAPALALTFLVGRHQPAAGRFVIGSTAAVLFLKVIVLLHPSKDVVDAVFHARRLGWVLDGNYYFTQPMPGGVQFPYAIGLYAAAAPFAALIRDHVALLRIVVSVVEALAGGCLYLVVARLWKAPVTAAAAAVLFHVAPLPYVVIGNANLTFAFGQAVAAIAASMALLLGRGRAHAGALLALLLVTALAYLSHVAVFPFLAVMLVAAGALFWFDRDTTVRRSGLEIAAVAVIAAILAVGIYYAHFPEVWGTLDRVSATQPEAGADVEPGPPPLSLTGRIERAVTLGQRAFGVPLLFLAAAGLVSAARGPRDRLVRGLAAWGIAMAVFLIVRTVAPVDARLQRYADEFIERVYYLTLPAVAILGAHGFATLWNGAPLLKGIAVAALGAAVWTGVERWLFWIS